MWLLGVIPFNYYTFALHLVSIYIGIAATVLFESRRQS